MWNYVRVGLVLALPSIIMGFNLRPREKIYIDVIKNITRVNNMLHDLLENYKSLKLDYEIHQRPENILSSEIESDDENAALNIKYRMKTTTKKAFKKKYDDDYHPVTQMIISNEDYQESNGKSYEDGNSRETKTSKTPPTKNEENSKSSDTKNDKDDNIVEGSKEGKILLDENSEKINDAPENILIGTALKYIKTVLPKYESKKKIKTRFEVLNEAKYQDLAEQDKPVLRTGSFGSVERVNDPSGHKTVVVLLSKEPEEERNRDADTLYTSGVDNTEDEMLYKEQLKTLLLRNSYGTACLKVAVRKCFKTLLQVRKIVCSADFRCRSSFKENFKSHSKTGCIKEFTISDDNNHYNSKPNTTVTYFGDSDDITRSVNRDGYFDICLPVMMSEVMTDANPKPVRKPDTSYKIQPINILRDRYERQCRRISKEKCNDACHYAANATCSQHKCVRHQKKEFRKTCRIECKRAFIVDRDSSDSSDSEDYSDSDSDSDSVSDF